MTEYPMLIPCICTIGHIYEWEAFLPDGIHDMAIGIECPKCKKTIGNNINGRFKTNEEIKEGQ